MPSQQLVTTGGAPLNPWLSIWTRPRATIRQIVDTDPTYMVHPLVALGGVAQALDRASNRNLGDRLPLAGILALAIFLGPVFAMIGLYLFGALMRWTGSWLGGVATTKEVRAAIAWGELPTVVSLLLWIPMLALFKEEIFTSESPQLESNLSLMVVLVGLGLVGLVLGIWQTVLLIKTVAEVHRFSAWKGLGTWMLSGLVVLVPVVMVVLGAILFLR
jgi:hypothetical protein